MAYLVDEAAARRSRESQAEREERLRKRRAKRLSTSHIRRPRLSLEERRKAREIRRANRKSAIKPKAFVEPMYQAGMGADFYLTREWKVARYKIFKRDGRECACCGALSGPFHIDHIKPRSKHPSLELDLGNLQVLCELCNLGKGNADDTDWRRGHNPAP